MYGTHSHARQNAINKQSFILQTKRLECIELAGCCFVFFCEMLFHFLIFNLSHKVAQVLFLDEWREKHSFIIPIAMPYNRMHATELCAVCVFGQMWT